MPGSLCCTMKGIVLPKGILKRIFLRGDSSPRYLPTSQPGGVLNCGCGEGVEAFVSGASIFSPKKTVYLRTIVCVGLQSGDSEESPSKKGKFISEPAFRQAKAQAPAKSLPASILHLGQKGYFEAGGACNRDELGNRFLTTIRYPSFPPIQEQDHLKGRLPLFRICNPEVLIKPD